MCSLKIISPGYSRTGTSSLKAALDQLGFPCYHMFEIFKRPLDASAWLRIYNDRENRQHLFEHIYAGYEAVTDFPSAHFYRELIEYYPDAKVILTVRDAKSWCESFEETIINAYRSIPCMIGHYVTSPTLFRLIRKTTYSEFGTLFPNQQLMIQVYEQHNADVIKHVPTERLLIYNIKQGWEPLCKFLNVPLPEDTPFPRVNDRKEMNGKMNELTRIGWLCIFGCFTVIFLFVGMLYYW